MHADKNYDTSTLEVKRAVEIVSKFTPRQLEMFLEQLTALKLVQDGGFSFHKKYGWEAILNRLHYTLPPDGTLPPVVSEFKEDSDLHDFWQRLGDMVEIRPYRKHGWSTVLVILWVGSGQNVHQLVRELTSYFTVAGSELLLKSITDARCYHTILDEIDSIERKLGDEPKPLSYHIYKKWTSLNTGAQTLERYLKYVELILAWSIGDVDADIHQINPNLMMADNMLFKQLYGNLRNLFI